EGLAVVVVIVGEKVHGDAARRARLEQRALGGAIPQGQPDTVGGGGGAPAGPVGEPARLGIGRGLGGHDENAQTLAGHRGPQTSSSRIGNTRAVTCDEIRLRLVSTSRGISGVSSAPWR